MCGKASGCRSRRVASLGGTSRMMAASRTARRLRSDARRCDLPWPLPPPSPIVPTAISWWTVGPPFGPGRHRWRRSGHRP